MDDVNPETDELDDDDGDLDLLDELGEDNGTPWRPADSEEDEPIPQSIQGRVSFIGEIERDQKYGGGFAPMLEVTPRGPKDPGYGDVDAWSVRAYHGVLAKKIQRMLDNGMKVGDLIALHYSGKVGSKNDQEYHNYTGKFVAR